MLYLLFFLAPLLPSFSYSYEVLPVEEPHRPQSYQPRFYPYDGGESAVYEASWSGIPVAQAVIHTSPIVVDGKKFYEVKIEANTLKYLDPFWKMRDSIESLFKARTLQPYRYVFHQRENRKVADTTAVFDPGDKKWVVSRQQGDKIRQFEFASGNTLDPVTAAYLARSVDFKVGDTLRLEVFGGRHRYLVSLHVVGRERVTVKAGVFDSYKITPRIINLTRSGYAKRVRQVTAWISADEKRRPLKVVSEVFIGSINIEMVGEKSSGEKSP